MRKLRSLPIALLLVSAAAVVLPAAAGPSRLRIVPGRETRTPSFVSGIAEEPRDLSPPAAARSHLKAHAARYRIDTDDLKVLEVVSEDRATTVRFGQRHRGVDVFGAQYLVHMDRAEDGLAVRSTNGHYFTDLDVDVIPRISERDALTIAVHRTRNIVVERVEKHGPTVLPAGLGIPTYHFTLWGQRLAGGQARQQVFINSETGATALSYNDIQTDGPAVGSDHRPRAQR